MHIRRGPAETNISNKTHPICDTIHPEILRHAIVSGEKWIGFNVSKIAEKRKAVGEANFTIADIVAITRATADKLEEYEKKPGSEEKCQPE